jgi:glycosyltransferase involved in cell wall biosynthesis
VSEPLAIGINALYLIPGRVGGTEIYLRGVLKALAELDAVNHYHVFTGREVGPDLVPRKPNFHWEPQRFASAVRPARILWEQTGLPLRAASLRLDALLNPGFIAPMLAPCPQVTVFHDLQHKRHPEFFRWFDLPFWRLLLFASAHVSRRIVADSEATRRDVLRYYRLPESRVAVVPAGVDDAFFSIAARRAPERFILAVSTLHPHKNLDGLLRAFAQFRRRHSGYRLIVCGLHGFFTGPLQQLREELGLTEAVEFPGWVPREELHNLFARAAAFVSPTFFEGFGIPVLEAMAAGVPLACSNIEPLAGIAGDGALLFDPHRPEDICECLFRLVEDESLAGALVARGARRARNFSWKATASQILDVLKSTIDRSY